MEYGDIFSQYGDAGVFHETCSVFSSERRGIYGYKAPKIICLRGTLQTPVAFCLACVQIPPPPTQATFCSTTRNREKEQVYAYCDESTTSQKGMDCVITVHTAKMSII